MELVQLSCLSLALAGSCPLGLVQLQAEMAANSPPKEDGRGMQESQVFLGNQLRRKKIPWTAEEEEKIKEGVQKFGKEWKKILQFGSHVFDKVGKRRTPHDLKDKWRNMCKAHSKSK
ncbi:hypothetical protein JHK85_008919 [Glycine max]|nr:hypothetical protein JHK85_008919 [Glycine max]